MDLGVEGMWKRAQELMPGGVNSPVRSFRSVGGKPFFVDRGQGPFLFDTEGRRYIDYVLSWGALILGHAHASVVEALNRQVRLGTSYGTPTPGEVELAERLVRMVPSVDMVRLVNSGTEATMSALRLARAVTNREYVLKFSGGYHGHSDSFLVSSGSGVATLSLPDSPGVPKSTAALTLVLPFNNIDLLRELFKNNGSQISSVFVEPVMGNSGLILPEEGFLDELRALTTEHGCLLIFDEVMTGFRVARGGAEERFGVKPDLVTLGKVIGGGLPVGAFGGSRELMEKIAPAGDVYQAGTLSGNPLATAAGNAQLAYLQENDPFADLESAAKNLSSGIVEILKGGGISAWGTSVGSMWGIFFTDSPVRSFEEAKATDQENFKKFHKACLRKGVFFAPSAFEAGFVSTEHTDEIIDETLEVVRVVVSEGW
jgi:glutamate-1-semialdehyde 2,1-aminomutase